MKTVIDTMWRPMFREKTLLLLVKTVFFICQIFLGVEKVFPSKGKAFFNEYTFPEFIAVTKCYMKTRLYLVNCKQTDVRM